MALTETWLEPHISDAQINIKNYVVSRSDRHGRGGGVCLYTHKSLAISEVLNFDDGICQCLMVIASTLKLCVTVVYRPPNANTASFDKTVEFIKENLASKTGDSYQILLTGDLNFPHINWKLHTVSSGAEIEVQKSARKFLQLLSSTMQNQYVDKPTRGANILDIFCTNNPFLVNSINVTDTMMSDHKIVHVSLSSIFTDEDSITVPDIYGFAALDFAKADYGSISSDILECNWRMMRLGCTFEEFPELVTAKLLGICEKHVPKRKSRTGKPKKLNALRRKRKRLENRISKASDVRAKTRLERELALIHYKIKEAFNEAHDMTEAAVISKMKTNPKVFYSHAKAHSTIRGDITVMRGEDGEITRDPERIANILQDQFISVYSDPNCSDKAEPNFPTQDNTSLAPECFKISEDDIKSALTELKPNSAPGSDGIPSKLLINCSSAIATPLALMWNESFESESVPSYYKSSLVCPIYKKDDRTAPENYRPISLTSHIMKTIERVVRCTIVEYLEGSDILSQTQHGFRSGRTTMTQLLNHFDNVFNGLLEGHDTDAIYLDYSKAFDKVDHELLLMKMTRYGFPANLVCWISSFLSNRFQRVAVKGAHSREAPIISGVPQGTVLGPVLFLVFINDLENKVINSNISFFADDTRISSQIRSLQCKELLQRDLHNVIEWSKGNNMELNPKKFELQCYFANSKSLSNELPFFPQMYSYTIPGNIQLEPKCSLMDLGVTVSNDLSWSSHIGSIVTRARGVAAWALSVFNSRDQTVMITLYKSLIRSHLEYCCPLWHPAKIGDIQLLESVQREFTRKIEGCTTLSYWDRLLKLKLLSLQRRRERYILLTMWKIMNRKFPNSTVKFRPLSRLGYQAVIPGIVPNSRTAVQTKYDNSFSVIGPTLWNALPSQLTTIESQGAFKRRLTNFISSLPDNPPVSGYIRANTNSLPEVVRGADERWSRW